MDCADFREDLRRAGTGSVSEKSRAHAESCARCAADLRGSALLRLGSSLDTQIGPGPGFEARLRSRLASEPQGPAMDWTVALGLVARPALALAGIVFLACLTVQGWLLTRTREADLGALAESDPAFASLLAGELDDLLEQGDAGEGAP